MPTAVAAGDVKMARLAWPESDPAGLVIDAIRRLRNTQDFLGRSDIRVRGAWVGPEASDHRREGLVLRIRDVEAARLRIVWRERKSKQTTLTRPINAAAEIEKRLGPHIAVFEHADFTGSLDNKKLRPVWRRGWQSLLRFPTGPAPPLRPTDPTQGETPRFARGRECG